jgi:hypothetical protein
VLRKEEVSYHCGSVGVVEDRLAQLSQARPWAMSSAELVAAVDLAQAQAGRPRWKASGKRCRVQYRGSGDRDVPRPLRHAGSLPDH